MLKPIVTAAAVLAVLTAPAVALDGPEETVRRVYDMDTLPSTAAGADALLARDMAEAYKRDLTMDEPQPSTDFDWRYGNQDWEITELVVGRAVDLPSVGGVVLRDVPVSFRDFNEPKTITWRMCLGRKGWRVADVRGPDESGVWSLRDMMKLPADPIRC